MSESLNGIYSANDGGFYYVRRVRTPDGSDLFWYGERPDGGFSNVMKGQLRTIAGSTDLAIEDAPWWDVPKTNARGASDPRRASTSLDLLSEGSRISKVSGSGIEFGGSICTRIAARPLRAPVVLESAAAEGLTGIWSCNDGGVYYIRQRDAEVVWFGQQCLAPERVPTFANVFVGTLSGTRIRGSWADVPYGDSRGSGTLQLDVSGSVIRGSAGTGFGGSEWRRVSISDTTLIAGLVVSLTCGGDDLRGGSVIYGSVELTDGRVIGRTALSDGNYLHPGQTLSREITLPPHCCRAPR